MPPPPEDDLSSLARANRRLYEPAAAPLVRTAPTAPQSTGLPHAWEEPVLLRAPIVGKHHVRLARLFFIGAFIFFILSVGAAGYLVYFGGNSVSVDKIEIELTGPTAVAGGDTVPLMLTITNRNPVAIENANIQIDFPPGTLSGDGSLAAYPRYTEHIDRLESGEAITRSIPVIVFGGAGEVLTLPIAFSYETAGSTTIFAKRSSYSFSVSTTPLSVSVEALSEAVSGKPLSFVLTVRSNANVPLANVVLGSAFPFGFTMTDSSVSLSSASSFYLGTLTPGTTKEIRLTGTLTGQNNEERVFHFTVGTSKSKSDPSVAVAYMTQDAAVTLIAPFISTALTLNGDSRPDIVVTPGSTQSVTLSYTNTLPTNVANATIEIAISGSAVDYNSIQTSSGFYRSSDHTVVYSKDMDSSLAQLAPGASGVGAFTFATLPSSANVSGPNITFTVSVSGTRVGQSNVPEQIQATMTKSIKVAAVVSLSSRSLHSSGSIGNSGPIPPRVDQPTTYTVVWDAVNKGSAIADGAVTAILPSYVKYTGITSNTGITYDEKSRTVTWKTGDLAQGAVAQGAFQVSFTPSASQKGFAPPLVNAATFSGYDRFAGIRVSATAGIVTTETKTEPGYVTANGSVQ